MNTKHNYSSLSDKLTKKISIEEKKNNGIYFTPIQTIEKNISYLIPYIKNIKNVLEPSCGSCNYILSLNEKYSDLNITGIENNKTIFNSITTLQNDSINLLNSDYLSHSFKTKYDLIIGNPPYFVMKMKSLSTLYKDSLDDYCNYFEGRPNIFILFIIKSLKLLNKNGILSFVLPNNFLNCLYYDKTRKYINEHYHIINIIECNDKKSYKDTFQETIILIIQNKTPIDNKLYKINISSFTIFGIPENIKTLKKLYINSTTLFKLGFNVNVGNLVWNQHKKDLTNDNTKTLVVYSGDIKNNKLEIQKYSDKYGKKNYINKKGNKETLLVINRGYGNGTYKFSYCIINETTNIEYLIENHVHCIKYINSIDNEALINLYKKIIKFFENKKTLKFVKLYFGNNAINTKELCHILPIYN